MSARAARTQFTGHRTLRLGIGPFARVVPALLIAIAWFTAAVVWGVSGRLPGGRWLVVHLFTLGVLTNLLLAFTQHFARSVTRSTRPLGLWHLLVLNGSILGVVTGMVAGNTPVLVSGASGVLSVIMVARMRLRQMRRTAAGVRFEWLVVTYERAHEALAIGAAIGAALGAGLIPGTWYGGTRLAHLHLNLLGWTGLVVLSTALFFAPAMLRVRIPDAVEDRAARSLRFGAAGLLLGAVLLFLPAPAGQGGLLLRLGAAGALALYVWPVLSVTRSIVRMARTAHACAARPLLPAAMVWFVLVIVGDVIVVATDTQRLLPAIGLAFGSGVLLQLIVAVGLYLTPSLRGRGFAARDALIARAEHGALTRAIVFNPAVLILVVGAAAPGRIPAAATVAAWLVVLSVLIHALLLAALPVHPDPTVARSSVARRYRAVAATG